MGRTAVFAVLGATLLVAVIAAAQRGREGTPTRSGPAACPKQIKDAVGPCADGGVVPQDWCRYPEGRCSCVPPRICSGIPRPPPPVSDYRWECQLGPTRPDGCPWDRPGTGQHCSGHPARCNYASCGGEILGCVDGGWQVIEFISPPP